MAKENSIFVFLGPSLPLSEAQAILNAHYLPPVSQGAVAGLIHKKPTAIVIIDGYFHNVPSVWHKEILMALSSGIAVFGASSMGALRAAELHSFGMQGIGTIYRWYKEQHIISDDEVALLHGPKESHYQPLSIPLVNIRATLSKAHLEKIINPQSEQIIFQAAQSLFYSERTYEAIEQCCHASINQTEKEHFFSWVKEHTIDLKKQDTITTLQHVHQWSRKKKASKPLFTLNNTVFSKQLFDCDRNLTQNSQPNITPQTIWDHLKLDPDYKHVQAEMKLQKILELLITLLDIRIEKDEINSALSQHFAKLKLITPHAIKHWMQKNQTNYQELRQYFRIQIAYYKVMSVATHQPLNAFLAHLQQSEDIPAIIKKIEQSESDYYNNYAHLTTDQLSDKQLAHCILKARDLAGDHTLNMEQLAITLGFSYPQALINHLLRCYGQEIMNEDSSGPSDPKSA